MKDESTRRKLFELSITEAELALRDGNYPIGSLIIDSQGTIISQRHNESATKHDITAHAEILNLRDINGANLGSGDLIMITSLEPCFGCSFFIARSQVKTIFYALKDPHKGGISDLKGQPQFSVFFQNIELIHEPYADLKNKSQAMMREYFQKKGRMDAAQYYE